MGITPRGSHEHGRRRDRARSYRRSERMTRSLKTPRKRRSRSGASGFRNAAASARTRFPVDPSSGAYCTIGGMVSTNAAGRTRCFFGSTRRWVSALDPHFADGSRARLVRGRSLLDNPDRTLYQRGAPENSRFAEEDQRGARGSPQGLSVTRCGRTLRVATSSTSLWAARAFADRRRCRVCADRASGATKAACSALDRSTTRLPARTKRESRAAACELLIEPSRSLPSAHRRVHVLPEGTEAVLIAEAEGRTMRASARKKTG
jgi:FAD/FMN-containing dehydrogenase